MICILITCITICLFMWHLSYIRVHMVVADGLAPRHLQRSWWRRPGGTCEQCPTWYWRADSNPPFPLISNDLLDHYDDVIMGTTASQITSLTIVYSIVYSGADKRKHQSSASLAFVWGIHRGPVPAQMASNAENVSICWRHHAVWHSPTIQQYLTWIYLFTFVSQPESGFLAA